jgi:pectinesterase
MKGVVGLHSFYRGYYSATFKCYGPRMSPMVTSTLTYVQAIPFIELHYISGESWIPSLPPDEE